MKPFFSTVSSSKANYVVLNDELVECKIIGYRISHNKETGEYELVHEVQTHLGVVFMPNGTLFYSSVESYKEGNALGDEGRAYLEDLIHGIFKCTVHDGHYVWAFINGDAVMVDAYDMYDYIGRRYGIGDYIPEGSIKLDCYDSREDVFNYNPKEYVDMDGTKKVSPGSLSKLLLTDEQTAIVAELRETLHRLNESGAQILWDSENDRAYIVNENDVVEHDWDNTPDGFTEFTPHASHLLPELYVLNTGGCHISYRFKNDEQ